MTSEANVEIDLSKTAEDLADAVQFVVSNGLNFLGLTQSPKINCINKLQECQEFYLFHSDYCWTKFCSNNQCDNMGFNATYNLYNEVFDLVFGWLFFKKPFDWLFFKKPFGWLFFEKPFEKPDLDLTLFSICDILFSALTRVIYLHIYIYK